MSGASNGLPSCCNCRSSCQQVWSFLWPWPRQKRLPGLPAIKPPKWLGGSHLVAIFFGVPGCNSSLQMGIRVWSPTQINQPGALIIWKLCRLCKLNTEHPSPSCSLVPVTTVAVATTTCTKMTKQQLLSRSFILQLFRCKAQKKIGWPLASCSNSACSCSAMAASSLQNCHWHGCMTKPPLSNFVGETNRKSTTFNAHICIYIYKLLKSEFSWRFLLWCSKKLGERCRHTQAEAPQTWNASQMWLDCGARKYSQKHHPWQRPNTQLVVAFGP